MQKIKADPQSLDSEKSRKALHNIRDIIRLQAKRLLDDGTRGYEFEITTCERENLAFNQYLALILMHHSSLQARFTVHFMIKDAIALAAAKLGVPVSEVSVANGVDYFKEFCNIVAGGVANDLTAADFPLVHSLPFAIQGYNDIFFPLSEQFAFCDAFYLSSSVAKVGISLDIAVTDLSGLESVSELDINQVLSQSQTGGFEYL